jgi:hypothetical protein
LISTGVTAASYTSASITVDADGRITAASSGSAGAGMGIPVLMAEGPASGTYTAGPTANRIGVYMYGGGGSASTGGRGAPGGGGFYNKPITQPFSQPYSVGGGGNPAAPPSQNGAGNAGGNTTIANVGTVNGGGGSPLAGNSNTPGNQPGASLTIPTSFRGGPIRYPSPAAFSGPNAVFYFGAEGIGFFPRGDCVPGAGYPGLPGALIIYENTGT